MFHIKLFAILEHDMYKKNENNKFIKMHMHTKINYR